LNSGEIVDAIYVDPINEAAIERGKLGERGDLGVGVLGVANDCKLCSLQDQNKYDIKSIGYVYWTRVRISHKTICDGYDGTANNGEYWIFMKKIEGRLMGKGLRFAVVGARWNAIYTDRLVDGAVESLVRHGVEEDDLTVVRVPGSFELPVVAKQLAKTGRFDGIVVVGTLIRGETDHYQLIASSVTSGIAQLMLESGIPITHGVLAVDNAEQAAARSGSKSGNKGEEAALAALELADLLGRLREK
jgi:6,7-dimethyl-8-ribityllumazine synthase